MPFTQNPPTVAQYLNALTIQPITDQEKNNLPSESRALIIKGGQGGDIGEKSYAPQTSCSNIDLTDNIGNINLSNSQIKNFNLNSIKTENDAGYAIRLITGVDNRCELNINRYSQNPIVSIYQTGEQFSYSSLYSGIATSSATISNNGYYGDFLVKMATPYAAQATLDTELNLNKYYLPFLDPANLDAPNNGLSLQKQINVNNLNNLFCFYVVDLDYFDTSIGYLTANTSYSSNVLTFTPSVSFPLYSDVAIYSKDEIYSVRGKVTSISPYKLSNCRFYNSAGNLMAPYPFYAGASICPISPVADGLKPPSLKFSTFSNEAPVFGSSSFFVENGSTTTNKYDLGLHLSIDKRVTSSNKEILNIFSLDYDKFGIYNGATSTLPYIPIQTKIEKLRTRPYITDQYGSNAQKLIIKNKPKFSLLYHGIVKSNNGFTYYCGNEQGTFYNYDIKVSDPFFGVQNPYFSLGYPYTRFSNGVADYYYAYYFDIKLYEVLLYKNLNFNNVYNPIEVIRTNLINKYKQKLFIDASVELMSSDMYYTYTDRINFLGKMIKT